jgi:hypothetical protein
MQTLAINLLPDYEALTLIGVALLGVGFMIWFLIALLRDARGFHREQTTVYVARKTRAAHKFGKRAVLRRIELGDRSCKTYFG